MIFIPIALQALVAIASIMNVLGHLLSNLMDPRRPTSQPEIIGAVASILLLTGVCVYICRRSGWPLTRRKWIWLGVISVLTALAGFAPQQVKIYRDAERQAAQAQENQQYEEAFLRQLRAWEVKVESLVGSLDTLGGSEAFDLVKFVARSDLTYRGLADHRPEAFALLNKALVGKALDPNVLVKGVRPVDVEPRPLFLQLYVETIEIGHRINAIDAIDWQIMQVLAANGADLSRPDAAALRADLAKNVVPTVGKFIRLQ
jgi:hypothetical protein